MARGIARIEICAWVERHRPEGNPREATGEATTSPDPRLFVKGRQRASTTPPFPLVPTFSFLLLLPPHPLLQKSQTLGTPPIPPPLPLPFYIPVLRTQSRRKYSREHHKAE